jgi:hypothetical protein
MAFIISNFGTYKAYKDWDKETDREYIVKLTNVNTSVSEIIHDNPNGITKTGFSLTRSEIYHGIFEAVTLSLDFACKTGGGGLLLRSAYNSNGILANVTCQVYKKNPATNDFDILMNYKVDFSESNYTDNVYFISANLIQQGSVKKLMTRDSLELDITKNVSVDGTTITDISKTNILFPGIDIYLMAQTTTPAFLIYHEVVGTFTDYPLPVDMLVNRLGGRARFDDPEAGKIYINNSEENRDVKFTANFNWYFQPFCSGTGTITLNILIDIYNSTFTRLYGDIILTKTAAVGSGVETGVVDFEIPYVTIPPGGFMVYKIVTEIYSTATLNNFSMITGDHRLYERSNSFGNTTEPTVKIYDAFLKSLRLITSVNDCLSSVYIPANIIDDTVILSGFDLRGFPNKGIILKFIDLFNAASFAEGLMMGWDSTTQKFFIEQLEYAYQDVLVVDFGKVKNFKSTPYKYYNQIFSGCNSDGDYEGVEQGVLEFNLKTNWNTHFEVPTQINQVVPFHLDSIAFETTRRMQYYSDGGKDTKFDSHIFMTATDGSSVIPGSNGILGFEGIEQYYNGRYISRENIKRNGGILGGIFWKETNGALKFSSNTKNITASYYESHQRSMNENLSEFQLGKQFFYPEQQTFETDLIKDDETDQLTEIRANPHGYYKCTDDIGLVHYGYFTNFDVQDFEKTAKVTGLTANIDR